MGDDMSDAEYGEFNNCFRNITRFRKKNPTFPINCLKWDDLEKAHYADIKERDDRIKELEERILELLNPQMPVDHDRLVAVALRQSDSAEMQTLRDRIAESERMLLLKMVTPKFGKCDCGEYCCIFGVNKPFCPSCGSKLNWETK